MWVSKKTLHEAGQQARLLGMQQAADALIRALSPFYEGDDLTVPGRVAQTFQQVEDTLIEAPDVAAQAEIYLAWLLTLGNAIGEACWEKAGADVPAAKRIHNPTRRIAESE
jgi:hypothetical protein